MSEWHGGKGSAPRPMDNRKRFEDNWDRIFNKNKQNENSEVNDGTEEKSESNENQNR